MITMAEWKAMGDKEQSLWLEENCPVNGRGGPRKPLHGVGINDAMYCQQPTIEGGRVRDPAYLFWNGMIRRAYDAIYHEKQPTYIGVVVCDEWLSFTAFRIWWLEHQVDGFAIDKDVVGCGKLYSPENCIFIPQWINNFTTDSGASRGEWPIGVSFDKRDMRFRAHCRNPISGKLENPGYFSTPEAAHLAWRARKLEIAAELKPRMDEIDQRIYPRVIEIINNTK